MSFWTVAEQLLTALAKSAANKASPAASPTDPQWMRIYIDVEKAAQILGVVVPAEAFIATDMEMLRPFLPFIVAVVQKSKPIEPGSEPGPASPEGQSQPQI